MTGRPPIIIIGMHRSGTSMVMRLLRQLGLFAGDQLEENSEALFFLKLNEWVMQQCGAAWDQPHPFDMLIANDDARSLADGYFRKVLNSRLAIEYLGFWPYLRTRTPAKLDIPWGWKDPRNTYTLPLWLDLFPDARVIHVRRHGVDVAQSLRIRSKRNLELLVACNRAKQSAPVLKSCVRNAITDSLRCLSLAGGFTLWEEYIARANAHVASLGENSVDIQYETLLDQPVENLRVLAQFCALPAKDEAIRRCSEHMLAERAFAYRSDETLVKFAKQHAKRLTVNGY